MSCADVAPIGAAAGVASDMDSELSLCDILSSEWRRHSGLSAREPDVAALTTQDKLYYKVNLTQDTHTHV